MTTTQPKTAKPTFSDSLRSFQYRNYRLYWFSGLGQTGAQGVQQLAMAWLVLDLTDSTGQLGLVIFMQGISMAGMALFGGVLVDRYDRKRLLMLSQLFTFANLALLSVLTLSGFVAVWQLYISAIGLGVMSAITLPARNALIASIVSREDSLNAVALNAMQMHVSRIFFPTVAGIVIAVAGVGSALLFCAASSLAGILLLLPVQVDASAVPARRRSSAARELVDGLQYTFSHPVIGRVMTLALSLSAFGLAFMSLGPGFAREELDFSASTTGLFLMAAGIGSLAGALMMVAVNLEANLKVFVWACTGFAVSLVALCINPFAAVAFLCTAGFGFSSSVLSIAAQTIFQVQAKPHLLGRVTSLWSLGGGLAAITALPIGIIGDLLSLRVSLGFVSILLLVMCAIVGMGGTPLRWLGSKTYIHDHGEVFEADAAG